MVTPDFDDEVVAGTCLTHDGVIRHGPTAEALAALAGETAAESASGGAARTGGSHGSEGAH